VFAHCNGSGELNLPPCSSFYGEGGEKASNSACEKKMKGGSISLSATIVSGGRGGGEKEHAVEVGKGTKRGRKCRFFPRCRKKKVLRGGEGEEEEPLARAGFREGGRSLSRVDLRRSGCRRRRGQVRRDHDSNSPPTRNVGSGGGGENF